MSHFISHAQVSLHPVASRHGTLSSTLVSVASSSASRDESSDREDGQGTPRLQRSSPEHRWSRSSSSLPQAEPSTYGIHHADLELYPVIYDEPLPSDSGSDDELDDQFDLGDDPTLDDGFPHTSSARSPPNSPRSRPSKCNLAAPVRLMTAEQLSRLHDQYVAQDVPHNVVFPYLHGVDGSIPVQNHFFGAPQSGQPTPAYRGLTIVRAEMPSRQELEHLSACSNTSYNHGRARGRTFSSVTTQSSGSSPDTDDEPARFEPSWASRFKSPPALQLAASTLADPAPISPASTASMSPSTASTVSSQVSRPSLFSVASESYSSGSRTSVSTASDMADDCARATGKDFDMYATRFYLQPSTSLLNSTVLPEEIIKPPSFCRTMYGRKVYSDVPEGGFGDERDSYAVRRIGARFVNPPQASGVSLRNFKIQNAKYATISDIVIYCPFGYHSGVLQLATTVREAQAALRRKRLSRGWGGLQYNVFVVIEPFKVFEERFPSMVAVDSKGSERNRIDFVERESDEMQRMARASEIHDNVWLGSMFDRPDLAKRAPWGPDGADDSAPATPEERDGQSNPLNFSICIDCAEDRTPWASGCTPKVLRSAAQYLDSVEASVRIDSETDKLLDSLHRNQLLPLDASAVGEAMQHGLRNPTSRDGSIVLGPNGWTPRPRSLPVGTDAAASHFLHTKVSNAGLGARNNPNDGGVLRIGANYAVQLDFQTGSGSAPRVHGWNDRMAEKLVNLCVWIHQQASPQAPPPSDRAAPKFTSISSTLRTFRDAARSPTRSFSPNHGRERTSHRRDAGRTPAAQRPRRVLLHCHDGYTETSTLALSYLMYARELSLPEAYLDLQLRANRSFFVYPADKEVLLAVDQLLQRMRAARRASMPEAMDTSPDVHRSRHAASKSFSGPSMVSGRRTDDRRSSLSTTAPTISGLAGNGLAPAELGSAICRTSTPTPTKCRTSPVDETHDWFHAGRFDGSLPSRILPFLYLGNLDHASNVDMLRVLGITHLVSVGETALEPPAHISAKVNGSRKEHGRSRYERASAKAALAEDPSTVPSCTYQAQGVTVLNVRNVSDDGIDSLRGTMREAVQFIEAARLSGGKVLVHCRVGVSRSTTIVLAYVMAHLDLGLVESYLLVRSRRLNIVIQPHLLFLWELRGWETFLWRAKQAQIRLLCGRLDSADASRSELPREASNALSALSIRSGGGGGAGSARSEGDSGSYRSAWSSPAGSPVTPSTAAMVDAVVGSCSQQWGEEHLPGVEIGAGAGSAHGVDMSHAAMMPFGSGSPTGLSYKVSRLTWGFLAREIADLNSRYFV
ncbi:related to protein tyrosine phosphatase PPS1 [Sporisorium reilianum f. sp. reilianum]|uniref:Related to protein tyrosine phosphatase PPS1 n=1 Tax=Sporisorium reilianum f. sp. reilianum TaxID=72559 RepID=A0A2N8U8I2_9BASI|nr:related to protein tyrosine phosphatase PPS1 [Sporisorium reilianum f. sp. reilianum]